jgi:hypothetical protein
MVPVPSPAVASVTLGELASGVSAPAVADFSVVRNVEGPAAAGAVAPEPPEALDPNTTVHVAPLVSVTPVTVMAGSDTPTVPQVDVV